MDPTTVLIDTSLFIEHIRAREKSSTPLMRIHERRNVLATSSIVAAELWYGARSAAMRAEVAKVLSPVEIIPFTAEAARHISTEAERLKARNAMIGFRDLAIASAALLAKAPLATHNRAEFSRVAGLELFDMDADA